MSETAPPPRLLRRRLREGVELGLLPLLCCLLPWRASVRLLRLLSRWRGWYREEVEQAVWYALRAGFAPEPEAFARRARWRLLIEGVDPFVVALRRRSRLVAKWVRTHGDPLPDAGPALFVGTHHGCGYLFVPFMAENGLPLNIVAPPMATVLQGATRLQRWFRRTRLWLLARAAGRPLVFRGGAFDAMVSLLKRGDVGFGLCDLPTSRADAVEVELVGRKTRLSPALFEIAERTGVPVYIFCVDIDLATGERHVELRRLRSSDSAAQTREFSDMLSERIRNDPSGWRFWSIGGEFFPELDHVTGQAGSTQP